MEQALRQFMDEITRIIVSNYFVEQRKWYYIMNLLSILYIFPLSKKFIASFYIKKLHVKVCFTYTRLPPQVWVSTPWTLCGKVGSYLPMVGSLQYKTLTN